MEQAAVSGRGRPQTVDPSAVIRAALSLFEQNGYASTTMLDVAHAAGISRKTLFVYFPTKADLVLGRQDSMQRWMRDRLGETDHRDPFTAIRAVIVEGLSAYPEPLATMKAEVRFAFGIPELIDLLDLRSRPWRDAIQHFLNSALPGRYSEALIVAVSYGFWIATSRGLRAWSATTAAEPYEFVASELDLFVRQLGELSESIRSSPR